MGSKRRDRDRALLGRFGRYVDYRRQQENLSFRGLATRARMAHSNIYEFSKMRKDPKLSDLQKLARAFNQPLAKFLAPFLEQEDDQISQ